MTKKLEELFDIASQEDNPLAEPIPGIAQEVTQDAINNLEKIENALPQVRGLEASDQELDDLADLADLAEPVLITFLAKTAAAAVANEALTLSDVSALDNIL